MKNIFLELETPVVEFLGIDRKTEQGLQAYSRVIKFLCRVTDKSDYRERGPGARRESGVIKRCCEILSG